MPGTAPLFITSILLGAAVAGVAQAEDRDLTELSLAELMDEPVTSVSKKETRLGDSATAISVITPDDLRRLGITTLAEALRLVPGFDVARIDANHWAVSSRGFNQQYANTLLVLIDGRSVYTPAFGGVYWDAQDVEFDAVERIEVIRGPGATLWGANAVNGVVNVITKRAKDSQGTLLRASLGTEERPAVDVRHGSTLGTDWHYRAYAKYFDREELHEPDPTHVPNEWRAFRGGFRADWEPSEVRLATVQGDFYSMRLQNSQTVPALVPPFSTTLEEKRESEGFNMVGRWTEVLSDMSHLSVQAWFDSYDRFQESRDTADLQLEHRFAPLKGHDIVWGAGYRFTRDDVFLGTSFTIDPRERDMSLYTAFAEDEITLIPERLRATLGVKLEHNDFSGLETQPNLRLVWTPTGQQTLWGSASRSVSTPSRFYHDARFAIAAFQPPGGPVTQLEFVPNPGLPAQKLDAYELGYRVEPVPKLSADLALFYNRYNDLYGNVAETPRFETDPVPHLVVPLGWEPNQTAKSHGAELTLNYKPLDTWRVTGTYSWLHLRSRPDVRLDTGSPAQQFSIRSYATLSPAFELNAALYYAGAISSLLTDTGLVRIPSYLRLDVGLIYHLSPTIEIGAWGHNLLEEHAEAVSQDTGFLVEVPRTVLGRITARF